MLTSTGLKPPRTGTLVPLHSVGSLVVYYMHVAAEIVLNKSVAVPAT